MSSDGETKWRNIAPLVLLAVIVLVIWDWDKTLPPDAPEYAALTSGTPQAAAFEKLLRDAESGQADVQYQLGDIYAKGEIVPRDKDKAVEWYSRAANLGHADAQLVLGYIYGNDDARRDKKESAKWFLKAAEQGIAEAQLKIGKMYYNGDGVSQNKQEAAQWFRRSAEQGNCKAQIEIVHAYYTGDGIEKNLHEAGVWYLIAKSTHNNAVSVSSERWWWDKFSFLMTDSEISAIKIDARQRIEKLGSLEKLEKHEREICFIDTILRWR